MTIQLYDKDECPFCWRLRMALSALKLEWKRNDFEDGEHHAAWQGLSPFKTVPVLCIDNLVLTDSSVAIEYLNERNPGIIWPGDIAHRAQARTIARFSDDRLGTAVRDVIFEMRGRDSQDWDNQLIAQATGRFADSLSTLQQLLDDYPVQTGTLSMLDMVMVTRLGLGAAYGLKIEAQQKLQDWFSRVFANPVVQQTAPQIVKNRVM